MRTMKLSTLCTALFCSGFSLSALGAEQDFDAVQVTASAVAGNVHMLQGSGGNIAVSLGTDGVLMVDDQFAPLSEKIKATIKTLGGGAPRFLLNTHHHGDHSGGNENFADAATIIAHNNVRVRLSDPEANRVPKALPVITYEDGITMFVNGEEIRVIHLPNGHTDGDSAIWFTESNVIHMGDEYVVGTFPFVDLTSGGSIVGLITNHANILSQIPDDIKIIPGHGPLSTKAEMAAWIQGVQTTAEYVLDQISAGKDLKDIVAAGLPDEYESWGRGFISERSWIEAIYQDSTNRE